MIRTTMAHKVGSNPGVMAKNIPGKPSSRNVINGAPSKKSCQADNFVYRKSGCGGITGGPGTKAIDGKYI
jgi:hypothetical protein